MASGWPVTWKRDAKRLHCQLVPGPGADDIIWGVIEGSELVKKH
jgi:hypothetical protein